MNSDARLWDRIKNNPEWQAIIRILYLSPNTPFMPEYIFRDSPLTSQVIATLHQQSDPETLAAFRQSLISLTRQPGTAHARDAALALSALGDETWVRGCVEQAGEEEHQMRSIVASLAFALACDFDHDRVRDLGRNFARGFVLDPDLALAEDLILDFTHNNLSLRDLDRGLMRDLNDQLISIRNLDLTNDFDLARFLDRTQISAREIEQSIQAECLRKADDVTLVRLLDSALVSVQTFQERIDSYVPLARVFDTLITTCEKLWPTKTEASADKVKPNQIQITVDVLTTDVLTTLKDELISIDDERREHARQILQVERLASALGQSVIEQMAVLADTHYNNPQIGTQLQWALYAIMHDVPGWIHEWVTQVSVNEHRAPAKTILRSIHRVTPETFKALMQTLPHTVRRVNMALLNSLSRLASGGWIPEERQIDSYEQLRAWLDQEMDSAIRCAIIEVLGHWGNAPEGVVTMLLDRLNSSARESDLPALYEALARLATRQPKTTEPVRGILRRACQQPAAAAALARLSVVEARGELGAKKWFFNDTEKHAYREALNERVLKKLTGVVTHPESRLSALLDAADDDDPWDDDYHGVLVIAARFQVERSPKQTADLLKVLVRRLRHALEEKAWPARRIALAVVAACAEVMPTALQKASLGTLETLLVKGTMDAESHNSRRFALTALSYLRTVTPAVVPALLAGCQDIKEVQRDAIVAASRFQSIQGDLLSTLIPALTGESTSTAYAVVQLLSGLGTSVAGETARLQGQIIEALVNALKGPGSQKGKLKEALYTALLQVASWTG